MINFIKLLSEACHGLIVDGQERKYTLILVSFFVLILGYTLTAFLPLLVGQFTIFVGGIITLYGIYCGANVGSKFSPESASQQKALAAAVVNTQEIDAQAVQNAQEITAEEVATSKSVTTQVDKNTAQATKSMARIDELQATKKDK